MNAVRFFLLIITVAGLFAACGEPADSPSLQEARKIHEQVNRLSGELHDAMVASLEAVEGQIEQTMLAGDSAVAMQLARVESRLGELDVRFHDWNETVVGIPGDVCNHDHAHDHGHDHGHDHDHGHGNSVTLEGMSDAEVLEIQQALLLELQSLQAAFDSVQQEFVTSAGE
jgi:ABC-type nickel/cobalt efflux system permease component RcnA